MLVGTRFNACQRQLTPTLPELATAAFVNPHGCRCHKSIAAPIPLAVSDLLSFCTTLSPLSDAAHQGHPWAYQCPFNFFLTSRGCRHANISFLSSCCFPVHHCLVEIYFLRLFFTVFTTFLALWRAVRSLRCCHSLYSVTPYN